MRTSPIDTLLRHVRQITTAAPDNQVSDRELLERFLQRREEAAFAALLHRHGAMVWGVCRGIVHDWHTAEDAFQATFLLLARRANTIRQRESVGSWLHGVARHVALKASARAARQRSLEGRAEMTTAADPLLDMSLRELQKILHEELEKLPEKYRVPLVHCYLEGKTHEQAALQLGWSKGAVRGRLNRGRELLRGRLTRRGLTVSTALLTTALTTASPALVLSAPLVQKTLLTATAIAPGAAEPVSAEVAALINSVANMLAGTRTKLILAVLLTLSTLLGAGVVAYSSWPATGAVPAAEGRAFAADNADAEKPDRGEPRRLDWHGDPLPPGALARLGTIRLRHPEGVQCVAFSPDGKTIACGSGGPIRFWDSSTGQEVRQLRHKGRLASIAFSPDGRWFTAAGGTHVHVWDAASGKLRHEFPCATVFEVKNGTSWLTSVPLVFSSDSATLASVNKDHVILLWDLATGKERLRLSGHEHEIRCLRFAPDGKTLVSAAGGRMHDGSIRTWDLSTGKTTTTVARAAKPFMTARFFAVSPDGSTLAVEALEQVRETDGQVTHVFMAYGIRIVDSATGKERLRFKGKNSVIVAAVFSPDGSWLALANRDNQVIVWDLKTDKLLHQLQQSPGGSTGGTYALVFAADGKTLASSAEGTALHLWDLATGRELLDKPAHGSAVTAVAFTPDGRTVATASADHAIRLWEARTGKALALLRGHKDDVRALAFSPDGRWLASSAGDQSVRLWDPATGREIHKVMLEYLKLRNGTYLTVSRSLAFTADGKALVAAGSDLQFHHWDVATGKEVRRRTWYLSDVKQPGTEEDAFPDMPAVHFSPDGKTAAVLSPKGLHFIDVASGQEIARADHQGSQECCTFAADGRTLLTGGWDKKICLWEVASGKRIRTIAAPDFINSVAFSPDGRHVAAGCGWLDASIRIHDIASGKGVLTFQGMGSYIGTLHFSPDGRTLASGQRDTTALLWDVSSVRRNKGPEPTLAPAELEKLWTSLQSEDAARGHTALWSFAAAPRSATAFFKDRLPAVPKVTDEKLRQLIAELDAGAFKTREAASKELLQLGSDAEPALRQTLTGNPSAEVRRRIKDLIENPRRLPPSGDQLRRLRAIAVLEQANSAEALTILRGLAQGAPAAPETQEAIAALKRLDDRTRPQP